MNNHQRASLLPLASVLLLIACCGVTRIRSHGNGPVVCPDERYSMHHTANHMPYCLRYFTYERTWFDSERFCRRDEDGRLFYPEDTIEYGSAFHELQKCHGRKSWLGVRLDSRKYYTSNSHERNSFWLLDPESEEEDGTHLLEIERNQNQAVGKFYWRKNRWYNPESRPFICNIAACTVDCTRLDALIAAFSALLPGQ